MDKPILLIKRNLLKPIEQALDRIEEIRHRKSQNIDKIILEGLFALSVASFEHSLNDTLKVLLTYIPEKLDIKTELITKEELIDGEPLEKTIENKIKAISYKNISDIIKYFVKTTDISETTISENQIDRLVEIKATRNLLIHNNLIVNTIYKETAGIYIRRPHNQNRLLIDQDYLFNSLVTMREVLENLLEKLSIQYSSFTKITATKRLFEYIFNTPILDFNNLFNINVQSDTITGYNRQPSLINSLSTSELFFYNLWLAHSHAQNFDFERQSFFHLDNLSRKKLEFFLSALDLLKS